MQICPPSSHGEPGTASVMAYILHRNCEAASASPCSSYPNLSKVKEFVKLLLNYPSEIQTQVTASVVLIIMPRPKSKQQN